jgi:subtilase family serine protease
MKFVCTILILAASICPAASLAAMTGTAPPGGGKPPVSIHLPAVGDEPGDTTAPAYDAEALRGATYLGPAHLGRMSIDVAMRLRDEPGLLRYAALVNDRRSLYYRRFLTPQQIGDFFGAPAGAYSRTMDYFWSQGLYVHAWRQRELLRVVGSQSNIERALGTRFGLFRRGSEIFYAPVNAPRFAAPLFVRAVSGIVTFHRMRRAIVVSGPFYPVSGFGPGLVVGNSPFDLAATFDYTGAYQAGVGCCRGDGITIGIVGTGPIANGDVPAYHFLFNVTGTGTLSQVDATDTIFGPGSLVACCYSTGLATPPPVTGPCDTSLPACNPEDGEAQLDTEQEASLAPDATVLFYLAYNPNECYAMGACDNNPATPEIGVAETDDELQQIIDDDTADVVAGSYGAGELDYAGNSGGLLNADGTGVEPSIFAMLATEGIAVFFASGDSGAEGCQPDPASVNADDLCVDYPASDPNVTAVGGLTVPIGLNGRLDGQLVTWGVQTQSGGAGGGGFSNVFMRPVYEPAGRFCANEADSHGRQCDSSHRLLPDVSLDADPTTGIAVLLNCGTFNGTSCSGIGTAGAEIGSIGGTSASVQDMAALWALVLEACKAEAACATAGGPHPYRLGNAAPLLYRLSAADRAAAFLDIEYGLNAAPLSTNQIPGLPPNYSVIDPGFNATAGYDPATGLGAPFARNLIKVITGM